MNHSAGREPVVWINNEFIPASRARISPFDRGFLFGDGLFESMRAENGVVFNLTLHLERLHASAADLRISLDKSIDWPGVLARLLHENSLNPGLARVKILATRGEAGGLGLPTAENPTCLALAVPYDPPSQAQYGRGWNLAAVRLGPAPPLARHKTLNYLYYMAARQEAVDSGANEALILDCEGNVSETAAGSILAMDDKGWWTPESRFQLPGATLQQLTDLLEARGETVSRRIARPKDLIASDCAFVLNSLMGVMPVRSIDGHPMTAVNAEKAQALRKRIFN